MSRAKKWEHEVSTSLKRLRGYSMRVEDGGKVSMNNQLCDFLYWDGDGNTFAIECKSTKQKSLPMKNFSETQLSTLDLWSSVSKSHHAVIAMNFYEEGSSGRAFLVSFERLKSYIEESGRSSFPMSEAVDSGIELERHSARKVNGGYSVYWDLRKP